VPTFTEAQLDAHEAMLVENVFQTSKWPHFDLLFRDIRRHAGELSPGATVVSLERGLLYGGVSLVAPFFHAQNFISVDCSPESADERGGYNAGQIDDPRTLRVPTTRRAPIEATGLEADQADLVLVPNLVHHVANQRALFGEMARIARPGGSVYVFEALLRELHQIPDDYLRYTPFGIQKVLVEAGLECDDYEVEGGPFSAIGYCWIQALQYFPEPRRSEMERWFFEEHWPDLQKWEEAHRENLVRKHTAFPVSFSVVARKPEANS